MKLSRWCQIRNTTLNPTKGFESQNGSKRIIIQLCPLNVGCFRFLSPILRIHPLFSYHFFVQSSFGVPLWPAPSAPARSSQLLRRNIVTSILTFVIITMAREGTVRKYGAESIMAIGGRIMPLCDWKIISFREKKRCFWESRDHHSSCLPSLSSILYSVFTLNRTPNNIIRDIRTDYKNVALTQYTTQTPINYIIIFDFNLST